MSNDYYIIKINKKLANRVIVILMISISAIFAYIVLYSYRYERFKDGHRYMRYDKWMERYEKYDIPTKKWKELSYDPQ